MRRGGPAPQLNDPPQHGLDLHADHLGRQEGAVASEIVAGDVTGIAPLIHHPGGEPARRRRLEFVRHRQKGRIGTVRRQLRRPVGRHHPELAADPPQGRLGVAIGLVAVEPGHAVADAGQRLVDGRQVEGHAREIEGLPVGIEILRRCGGLRSWPRPRRSGAAPSSAPGRRGSNNPSTARRSRWRPGRFATPAGERVHRQGRVGGGRRG